jgi:1,4-dihydroxy-2-naphthoyl-CoA hydrolase
MTDLLPERGMPEHFGILVVSAEKDKLVGELDVDHRHVNNSGNVHGGALLAFADDLGGGVAKLNIPSGFRSTTIESKSNILRACTPGKLTGVATPLHVGRRTVVVQTSIYRADGKLAVVTTQTQLVLPREPRPDAGDQTENRE